MILIAVLGAFAILMPTITTAQTVTLNLHMYLAGSPNPVGLSQPVVLVFGFTMPTLSNAAPTYQGFMITITDPTGRNDTKGPFNSDSTGLASTVWTPTTTTGNYTIQAYYPGGNVTFSNTPTSASSILLVAATYSNPITISVQETPIPTYQQSPLPTAYWEYPINGQNYLWSQINGNWLMGCYDKPRAFDAVNSAFNPYTIAPESGHIMWTYQMAFGGQANAILDSHTYYAGASYRYELNPPIIMNGRLYINIADPPVYGFKCVDLYTGQTIWTQNQTFLSGTGTLVQGSAAQLTLGQILFWGTANQHGAVPYLWSMSSTTWARYDAWTGNLMNTFVNASTGGTTVIGPNGEVLVYYLDSVNGRLSMWNSSLAVASTYNQGPILNIDWKGGIQWNVSTSVINNGGAFYGMTLALNPKIWTDPSVTPIIIATNQTHGNPLLASNFMDVAYDATTGAMLWTKNRSYGTFEGGYGLSGAGDNMYAIFRKETSQLYVFSMKTGDQLWISDPLPSFWDAFPQGIQFAYGRIYMCTYSGTLFAWNATTGYLDWTWNDNSVNPSGDTTPYGAFPLYGGVTVADGKVFVSNGEHTANSPLYPGAEIYAINATDGSFIWQLNGWFQDNSVANGYLLTHNGYDSKYYCIGKGPSQITVNTPSVGVTTHRSVTLTGTIADICAGSKQTEVAANFPNGLPCVSDDSMTDFMKAVYGQQSMSPNTKGVPITLSVIDSNNNYRQIGTTTSDVTGKWAFNWTPDIAGEYQVTANFAGSNSYYPSTDTGYFYADQASAPEPTATNAQPIDNTPVIIGIGIAIIIAVIVVGTVLAMMIRKRP